MTTPTNHHTSEASNEAVTVTGHTVASVAELLAMSEEFLRTAGPLVHAELRTYLAHRCPPADPSWFIDVLGFSSIHLGHLLRDQAPAAAPPSVNWQQPEQDEHDEQQGAWA
ncbi:MAG: hypothetical protein QM589_17425 [Thermomicrobiales bacterium]